MGTVLCFSENDSLWTGKPATEVHASRTCTLYWWYLSDWAFGKGTEARNGWLIIHLVRFFISKLVCWGFIKIVGRVAVLS